MSRKYFQAASLAVVLLSPMSAYAQDVDIEAGEGVEIEIERREPEVDTREVEEEQLEEQLERQGETGDEPTLRIETGASEEDYPPPPAPPTLGADDPALVVRADAGVGSDVAYARQGVVEIGGGLAFSHQSETTLFRISPMLGVFVLDGLELSAFVDFIVNHVSDDIDSQTDVIFAGLVDISYHLALMRELYVFVGIGTGVSFSVDPGADLIFRPRAGVDLMIGRSGILRPQLFMDVGINDGLTAGGVEAAFTVMF